MGIGIIFLPLHNVSSYLIYVQIILALFCLKVSIGILRTWKAKKRRYNKLIQENISCFNPASFEEYMKAPCGRLLVRVVLEDLGEKKRYDGLKVFKVSWRKTIKSSFKRKKTIIYRNNNI